MPVVVTGASGLVGRTLIPTLVASGSEVRAIVRDRRSADALRSFGAKAARVDLDDPETLGVVMDGAHTVCHLVGGLDLPEEAYEDVNLGSVRRVLSAAVDCHVSRFLFLSYPGASPDAENAYLRAKGAAEALIAEQSIEHVIIRATHIYGPGSRWLDETARAARRPLAAVVIGSGSQRLAPVFVKDVAVALAAADDRSGEISGTFGLQGPDEVTADQLTDLLAGRRRRKVHLVPSSAERLVRLAGRRVSRTMLEVLAADSLADAPDAAAEFGIEPTPLERGLTAAPEAP